MTAFDPHGARVLVTGASSGIGAALAEELAARGAVVGLVARRADRLEAVLDRCRAHVDGCRMWVADLADPAQVADVAAAALGELGGIDVLVNNAGAARPGNFETLTDDDWRADVDVKLFSMIRSSREVIPHMRARGRGRIVNINAVYGRYPHPDFFATSVNRAACLSFTKALAFELGPDNILVNSVNIGFVESSQWERIRQRRAPDLEPEEFFRRTAEQVPLGRFGKPEEVSGLVAFLASERASYITGASIDVAGGFGRYL